MECYSYRVKCPLTFYLLFSCLISLSLAQSATSNLPFKAVNLGGWLVAEGWIKPSLFKGIPNGDLLDGTQVQFMSGKLGKYLSAESGGGTILVANRPNPSGWETFRLWRINESTFNLRVFNKQFVGLNGGNEVVAVSSEADTSETFQIVRKDDDPRRVRIKAPNGFFLQAKTEASVTADFPVDTDWRDDDPSVFVMTIITILEGEYQLTNGYGPERALQVMREHWSTYITEEDFMFMSENGLNAVRIPVGWWIMSDPTPPKPFVGGSLEALDNAFTWAQKYNMKVIVDLHAVPGSQNGNEHSGTRDGYEEWGDSYIQETVAVIDFLAARYGNKPSFAAIELMNEPVAPGVTIEDLSKYYKAGYDAGRKYSSSAYVILSNRLGPADRRELLSLGQSLSGSVIDVHYYNLYSDKFKNMNVQENIDFIYNERAAELSDVTTPNGPLSFCRGMDCSVVSKWSKDGRLRKLCKRPTRCIWTSHG
ncbi:PREDICTED: probable glucan 1,3-beta-glucosidase ARB_04467 [Nelumbo nucifera]|uniref:Probable glucan 1,3-beta-glucosidase ARB_04467 n=1 Tax=Nelumbo nucifera TaxID=4432 RepID=A0A1U8AMY9_NELNU|nr:PREDICTED: probable glucan 1,3-beta-glucosidase ARB_04467 [Nelumbo nucifera]